MRPAALAAVGGAATALVALVLAAVSGGPYLTAERVNGWVVVFAAALLTALIAAPFLLEAGLRRRGRTGRSPDEPRDERWEGAALAWGGVSLAVLAVAIPVGISESFSGSSLAGTAALLATIEAGIVLGALLAWLLAG